MPAFHASSEVVQAKSHQDCADARERRSAQTGRTLAFAALSDGHGATQCPRGKLNPGKEVAALAVRYAMKRLDVAGEEIEALVEADDTARATQMLREIVDDVASALKTYDLSGHAGCTIMVSLVVSHGSKTGATAIFGWMGDSIGAIVNTRGLGTVVTSSHSSENPHEFARLCLHAKAKGHADGLTLVYVDDENTNHVVMRETETGIRPQADVVQNVMRPLADANPMGVHSRRVGRSSVLQGFGMYVGSPDGTPLVQMTRSAGDLELKAAFGVPDEKAEARCEHLAAGEAVLLASDGFADGFDWEVPFKKWGTARQVMRQGLAASKAFYGHVADDASVALVRMIK